MQPCPVCGGMGIDTNGYCTQCRTYRGVPQTPPPSSGAPYSPPYSGAPYSGAPYSGPPYSGAPPGGQPYAGAAPQGGYPVSPGPTYQQVSPQQISAPPTAYPPTTYGGAYGAPTTPRKTRSSFATPLIALSATLVVLVIAIVVVVIVKNSGGSGGGGTTTPKALIDECVVGTWVMSAYSEDVPVPQVGSVKFTLNGKGATIKFTKDGKGTQDFGSGTVFSGDVAAAGQTVRVNLTLTGKVTYDVRTNDGTMSFSHPTSDVKATVTAPTAGVNESQDYQPSTDPSKYNCSGDTMSMSTSSYKSDLKRVSRDA